MKCSIKILQYSSYFFVLVWLSSYFELILALELDLKNRFFVQILFEFFQVNYQAVTRNENKKKIKWYFVHLYQLTWGLVSFVPADPFLEMVLVSLGHVEMKQPHFQNKQQ